ncbi:hypothetical protein [uncultured Erythrobacter sp.]|uniref:hypothetical protein n=1 Tax=uncultured Erythrobacter sp. TaxID=263913 RepID=UPI00260BAEE3|nr:hypothetical protein [uncultured Erythrobacter sp.]
MAHQSRIAGYAGIIAAASLAFTPAQAQAAETAPHGTAGYATGFLAQSTALNSPNGSAFPIALPGSDNVQEWRRGWRRGWRGRRYRGRRGIRGGDILAGALVIGGIAAIASAANNNRRRDREVVVVDRRVRDRDYDYRPENRRNTRRSTTGGSGIDNAVSMCLNEIEQDIRVDSVDGASRVGSGWIVTGSLFDGSGFSCQIDNSGQISGVDYGRGGGTSSLDSTQTFARAEGQWSDDRYANARADVGGGTRPDLVIDPNDERLPAYPGGPLPGEESPE